MIPSPLMIGIGGCLILLVMVLLAVILVSLLSARHRKTELAQARQAYLDVLAQLKKDPRNEELRETVSRFGQNYILLRQSGPDETRFSEEDLRRDLRSTIPRVSAVEQAGPPLQERLDQLKLYHQRGLLSDAEYEEKRAEIVGG